jgi:hypothetical protein
MLSKNASPLGKASATQYFHFPYSKHIAQSAKKAGPLAKRVSDVFSQSRASSIVKGFENAAPAWLAQAPPCAFPIRVCPCHPWFKTSAIPRKRGCAQPCHLIVRYRSSRL